MFVLPAEYAVDPLGTGARVGLLDLGVAGQQVEALAKPRRPEPLERRRSSSRRIARSSRRRWNSRSRRARAWNTEYRLDKGEALLYSWKATAPVNVEFHAEPDGAPRGYAQTYEKTDARPKPPAR